MPTLIRRVLANPSYLLKHQRVEKTGDQLTARWSLVYNQGGYSLHTSTQAH